ncbi:MAG: aldo/keto reductase [Acidobacteria bacterium]|nr:MAG: aldo/keto reductase [Acidobacteriota bacterium]
MERRDFLKFVGATAGAAALSQADILAALAPAAIQETVAGMPRRVLGRTGRSVSIIGFPGLALSQKEYDQARCTKALHDAFANGLNYFDVAPAYGRGLCETRMGIGLQGLDRTQYFLACKTNKRDREGSLRELEHSLTELKTDHFDLYQLHHLRTHEEVKQVLGPKGALETFAKAREQGKVKHLGFSAHTTVAALEAMKGFQFDSVMFPINFVEFFLHGFGKEVMELANQQGAGLISIKPLSHGSWPQGAARPREWWYRCTETDQEVARAIRWTLSLKGLVAGIPPSWLDLVEKAIKAAKSYQPATENDVAELRQLASSCLPLFNEAEGQAELDYPNCPYSV